MTKSNTPETLSSAEQAALNRKVKARERKAKLKPLTTERRFKMLCTLGLLGHFGWLIKRQIAEAIWPDSKPKTALKSTERLLLEMEARRLIHVRKAGKGAKLNLYYLAPTGATFLRNHADEFIGSEFSISYFLKACLFDGEGNRWPLPSYRGALTPKGEGEHLLHRIAANDYLLISARSDEQPLITEHKVYGGSELDKRLLKKLPDGLIRDEYGLQYWVEVENSKKSGMVLDKLIGYLLRLLTHAEKPYDLESITRDELDEVFYTPVINRRGGVIEVHRAAIVGTSMASLKNVARRMASMDWRGDLDRETRKLRDALQATQPEEVSETDDYGRRRTVEIQSLHTLLSRIEWYLIEYDERFVITNQTYVDAAELLELKPINLLGYGVPSFQKDAFDEPSDDEYEED